MKTQQPDAHRDARQPMPRIAGLVGQNLVISLVFAHISGCGAPEVVDLPPPKVAPPVVAQAPDAFADHRGQTAKTGELFRIGAKPVGVQGVGIVVTIVKVDWQTMTGPSGKEVKEATATLRLQKGEEERNVTISQGDKKTAYGCVIELLASGDQYDKARLSYDPWVELRVQPAATPSDPQ